MTVSPLVTLRWALQVYRDALNRVAPSLCRQIDDMMSRSATTTVRAVVHPERYDDADVLPPDEAAQIVGISKWTLAGFRRRGEVQGVLVGRQFHYTVAELRTLARRRASLVDHAACKVSASGESLSTGDPGHD